MKKSVYFAPLEGITGSLFRTAYNKFYEGIDCFYAPFISPYGDCVMTPKERRDVEPLNNQGIKLIPQVLANNPTFFKGTALELKKMGYDEININIGCPSGTVCSKKKGAGLLSDTKLLDEFLDGVFNDSDLKDIRISVKTRIGYEDTEEFPAILDIYNKYPLDSLIIHPRLRKDMYKGKPRMDSFIHACKNSKCKLVYNGDIFTLEDYFSIPHYDNITGIMMGRGILKDPLLPEKLRTGKNIRDDKRFMDFHNEIYEGYKAIIQPDIHVLFRMKELWTYFISMFPDNKKAYKSLIKSQKYPEYDAAVRQIVGI